MLHMEVNMPPRITAVVPCYNYGHYLTRALQSIYNQTYKNWECIIVDDGSSDNTADIARQWVNQDSRFILISQDNAGLPAARNVGVKHATGQFIQFLDADDTLQPDKWMTQLELFNSQPDGAVVYSSFEFENEHGKRYTPEPSHYLIPKAGTLPGLILEWEYGFILPIHCFLFCKKDLVAVQFFSEGIPTHEDLDLHLRLAMSDVRFIHHPGRLATYHVHSSSMSRDYTRMQLGYLIVLGRAFYIAKSVKIRLMLLMRFGIEVNQSFIHFIRRRKINFAKVLLKNNHPFFTLASILLLPVFIFFKVVRKFV